MYVGKMMTKKRISKLEKERIGEHLQKEIYKQRKKHIDKITDFIYGSKSWRNNKLDQNEKNTKDKK